MDNNKQEKQDGMELELFMPGITGSTHPEEIEEVEGYSIEPHGPPGQYALYFGRSPHFHGYNLCAVLDFDANGENTRRMLVDSLNDFPGALHQIQELQESLDQKNALILEMQDELAEKKDTIQNLMEKFGKT